MGTGLTFNPSTNTLATTTFSGALSGNATNITATSNSTLTTLPDLTTAAALATVGTVTTGTWNASTIAIAHGGTGEVTANPSPSPSTFAAWDANNNLSANAMVQAYATTATAAGTTTLTVASAPIQYFTGTTTQTIVLPVVSTLPQKGFTYSITNNSTGLLTVESSGANVINTIAAGRLRLTPRFFSLVRLRLRGIVHTLFLPIRCRLLGQADTWQNPMEPHGHR